MNLIFGGHLTEAEIEQNLKKLVSLSKQYLPADPEIIRIPGAENSLRLCALRGTNNGIGYYANEKLVIFLDGELYNPQILGDFSESGTAAIRDRWAEGLAKKYLEEGENFIGKIDGIFSLAIYDRRQDKILLARDSKGYRMLYYALHNGNLIFSTRLWLVAELRKCPAERLRKIEPFHLIYGSEPLNTTVVSGINKVRPGYLICYDIKSRILTEKNITTNILWPYIQRAKECQTINAAKSLFYEAFMASLDETTHYEKRIAVLLGGVDSAAVANGLKRLGRDVETYTFLWENSRYNQKNIGSFQNFTGIKQHWMPVDLDFFRQRLENMPNYIDEPRSELTYLIGTTELCGLARRDGFNLIATGDEAESTMGGYPALHQMVNYIQCAKKIPEPLLKKLTALISKPIFIDRFGQVARLILTVLKKASYRDEKSYFMFFRLFDESEVGRILTSTNRTAEEIKQDLDGLIDQLLTDDYKKLSPVFLAHKGNEALSASIRFKHAAPAGIYDVALTSPFIHKGFAQFLKSFGDNIFYPHGYKKSKDAKWLFREMLKEHNLLPEIVTDQKKLTPGNSPIDYWLENEFKQEAAQIINRLPPDFSREYVQKLFSKKLFLEFYRRSLAISAVTSHALQALIGYSIFWEHLNKKTRNL